MSFDAASARLRCGHCGASAEVPSEGGSFGERALERGLAAVERGLGAGESRVSRCQECGANVVFAGGATATACTFCGSARVLEQSENRNAIRPESLLPFQIDKPHANQAFGRWLGKLWFRPSDLKRMAKVQEVNGVYVPFWTFDAHVDSSWTAEAGYHHYETETYTEEENGRPVTRERRVQHTRWEPAEGQRADDYDELLVCGSVGLPRELAERLKTFDTGRLVPYAPGYLAGWRAEEYAVDLEQSYGQARDKIIAQQQERCAGDVPGDTHRDLQVQSHVSDVTFKHVLLPVWIAAYRYNNKVYRFLVNGQTEEVVGDAPWSAAKILSFILSIAAIIGLAWYFGGR